MTFRKYQHIEKFGCIETLGIEAGEVYVFPKIDGTNASIWVTEKTQIGYGSRNMELSLDKDNAGFMNWAVNQENIKNFLLANPKLRLFGEWLVPHSLKTYRDDAWKNFYVFDVVEDLDDEEFDYLHYKVYQKLLEDYQIKYIPPIAIIRDGHYESFVKELQNNVFLINDGHGIGEGIVLKNYSYTNKFGRKTWAKIVISEFKESHNKIMGVPIKETKQILEKLIVDDFVSEHLVEKEYNKIVNVKNGWSSKFIPMLLNTIFYCLIKENSWEFVKKYKDPIIDYKTLRHFTFNKVKQLKKGLF